ncbi:hypothetical protein LCGC14_0575740 [marine sediment metagenome]|uniref:Uncharacterized protein n=1 Tax=marine sediment metagenome TaxID=412755 RepID=A0A0F9U464_9ZZZZ
MDHLAKHRARLPRWPLERIQQKMQLIANARADVVAKKKPNWVDQFNLLNRTYRMYSEWYREKSGHTCKQPPHVIEQQRRYDEKWNSGATP